MNYLKNLSYKDVYSITTEYNNKIYYLGSQIIYEHDKYDENDSKVHFHLSKSYGQEWVFNEIYNGLYEILFNDDIKNNSRIGYYLNVDNKNNIILSKNKKTLWKFEKIENKENEYYIKNCTNNFYLTFNIDLKRDQSSYYISLDDKLNICNNIINFSISKIKFKKNNVLHLIDKNYVEIKEDEKDNEICFENNIQHNVRFPRTHNMFFNIFPHRHNNRIFGINSIIQRINFSGGHEYA